MSTWIMSQVFGVLLVLSGSSVAKKQLVGPVPQQMQGASNTVNHPPLHRVEKDNVTMPSQNEHRLDPDDPGGITDKDNEGNTTLNSTSQHNGKHNFTADSSKDLELSSMEPNDNLTVCPEKCNCSMEELNCTRQGWTSIPSLQSVPNGVEVKRLNLSINRIKEVRPLVFATLALLSTLDLSRNRITELQAHCFDGPSNLTILVLAFNRITRIGSSTFQSLLSLTVIDLRGNTIINFKMNVFKSLKHVSRMYTENPLLCCLTKPSVKHCHANRHTVSSCANLLKYEMLRIVLWIVASLSFIGNVTVMWLRVRRGELGSTPSFLVFNLAMADWLMCCYLFLVAGADLFFRHFYVLHDLRWRHSALCSLAGTIFTVSSEVSVLTLALITLERIVVIVTPGRMTRWNSRCGYALCALAWLLGIALGIVPILPIPYFARGFYSRSSLCVPLHITRELAPGWQYAVSVFMGLNSASLLIVVFGYLTMYLVGRRAVPDDEKLYNRDVSVARTMALIVLTDVCCWLPIIILNICALMDVHISEEVYAWVVVLVLPLNSATNPMLYTLMTLRPDPEDDFDESDMVSPNLKRTDGLRRSRCNSLPDINMSVMDAKVDITADGGIIVVKSRQSLSREMKSGLWLTMSDIHTILRQVSQSIGDLRMSGHRLLNVDEDHVMVERLQSDGSLQFSLCPPEESMTDKEAIDSSMAELAALISRLMKRFNYS